MMISAVNPGVLTVILEIITTPAEFNIWALFTTPVAAADGSSNVPVKVNIPPHQRAIAAATVYGVHIALKAVVYGSWAVGYAHDKL